MTSIEQARVGESTINDVMNETFMVQNGIMRYMDFYNVFAESHYGQHQAMQRPRYHKKYPYDTDKFLEDLGDDVHPVRHMTYTHDEVVVPLLQAQIASAEIKPTKSEITHIRLAALTHDIGECEDPSIIRAIGFVTGDILYHEVTPESKIEEKKVRQHIFDSLPAPYTQIPDNTREELELVIDNVRPNNFADQAFNACEHLGYYETGILAGNIVLEEAKDLQTILKDERLKSLARLAVLVSIEWRHKLSDRLDHYPYIQQRFDETTDTYEKIVTDLIKPLALS